MPGTSNCFTTFEESVAGITLPERFTNPFEYQPHPLCLLAAKQLQHHLMTQTEWEHNFGLKEGMQGDVMGKMFGVLVVKTKHDEIGYLAAFSGTLADSYNQSGFVPAIYDALTEEGFLNNGMLELATLTKEVRSLEQDKSDESRQKLEALKKKRKAHSASLSVELFKHYHFLNQMGVKKSLQEIFEDDLNLKIPGGAGDCAAPKLLQYAFQQHVKPLAMAEFFWGIPRTSDYWQHDTFYPACDHKCKPILSHMLKGIEMDTKQAI